MSRNRNHKKHSPFKRVAISLLMIIVIALIGAHLVDPRSGFQFVLFGMVAIIGGYVGRNLNHAMR